MLRAIASSAHCTTLAGVERRATAAAASRQVLTAATPRDTGLGAVPPCHSGGRASIATRGIERDGDFGARDPFDGEVVTQFGGKPLGGADTLHVVKPPEGMDRIVGLKSKHCTPCEGGNVPKLSPAEAESLRTQVGWRLVTTADGKEAIRHEYKVRNFQAAISMFGRVAQIAEAEGHHPDLHLTGYNNVAIELTTHAVGGLTLNDFIVADKINDMDLTDLLPKRKPKYWA